MPPSPSPHPSHAKIAVSTQMLCSGKIPAQVFVVPAPSGYSRQRNHIGIQIGRCLIYLEDEEALSRVVAVVSEAQSVATSAFTPVRDAFDEAEGDDRRRFERTGDVRALRR